MSLLFRALCTSSEVFVVHAAIREANLVVVALVPAWDVGCHRDKFHVIGTLPIIAVSMVHMPGALSQWATASRDGET